MYDLQVVGLKDQVPLSAHELTYARRVAEWTTICCRRRDWMTTKNQIDQVALPASNWRNGLPHMYRHLQLIESGQYDRLRFFAAQFTGWPLLRFGDALPPFTETVDANEFDAALGREQITGRKFCDLFDALCEGLPDSSLNTAPPRFGEIGFRHRDMIINHDTCAYYERLATMWRADLVTDRRRSILEIGGGYGALGFYLSAILPHAQYTIIDIPESLLFSAIYLPIAAKSELSTATFGEDGIGIGRFRSYRISSIELLWRTSASTLRLIRFPCQR